MKLRLILQWLSSLSWKKIFPFILLLVHLLLYLIQCSEEPFGGHGWPHQNQTKHIPVKHMAKRCMRTGNAHANSYSLQFVSDPAHPDQRIDEKSWNSKEIGLPIWHDPVTKDFFDLILQTTRHIEQKKQAGSEEIDKAKEKSRPICVFVFHIQLTTVLLVFLLRID